MTDTLVPFNEAEFHARQRARLCSARHMPPFAGRWADSLVGHLHQQLPQSPALQPSLPVPMRQQAVVDCFAQTPVANVERLFHALGKACATGQDLDEDATLWATELTVYAALRAFDPAYLGQLPVWRGTDQAQHAALHQIPVSSSLVAALAMALLTGRYLRLGDGARPRGVIDLTTQPLRHTDQLQSLLMSLYDHQFREQRQRTNPDAPLSAEEIGALRDVFDTRRLDGELAAPYMVLDHLDVETRQALGRSLGDALNTPVIDGAAGYDDQLVQRATQFTVPSLAAKVDRIFRLLPHFATKPIAVSATPTAAPAPTPTKPAAPPVSPTTPLTPPPAYTWDLFISHASEDKERFVLGLVKGLEAVGLRVWYDAHELKVGDSLHRKIAEGLRQSRHGVVVLSPWYFAFGKGWAQGELDALITTEFNHDSTRVLPVWLDLTRADVERHAPMLAGKLAVHANQGLPAVVAALLAAVQRQP